MFEQVAAVVERASCDDVGDALLVIDPGSGYLSYVNAAAADLFGLHDASLAERMASDLVPELASLAPRTFETHVRGDGRERRVAVRLEHLRGGAYSRFAATLVSIRRLDELALGRAPIPREKSSAFRRAERLESLWSLVVRRGFAASDQVKALLREGSTGIALERATLARLDGEELVVEFAWPELEAGARVPLEHALSRAALARSGTFAVLDTRVDPEFRRIAGNARCFLASAFRVGEMRWVLTFSSGVARQRPFDDDDWRYVENLIEALARGIERRERDARIERLAYSDALTALPNRVSLLASLDDALAEAERGGERVAVLFLDIDGFKNVNDSVGHRAGDVVLAEVAQRLRGTLRKEEFIGRLGGDEFAIVMPHVSDRDEIESIAQRIAGVLTFPFAVDDYRFELSASIGVAVYPEDATGREELLAAADAAMYAAKEDGGSRLRFRDGPTARGLAITVPASPPNEWRDASYMLCYQPILDLRSGRVLSAEALIRRVHPVHGLMAPERGWSIARDEAGRRALDRWVVREATMQARTWHERGTPLRVDINLAAFDRREIDAVLADPALAPHVRRLRIEIAPQQFEASGGPDDLAAFVGYCAASGIRFALDGFGGNLGALGSFANLPIEAVKLERQLVEQALTSRAARALARGTIAVAKSLGWSVIGKGVETSAELDALAALDCDEIQGFYVAHPMTAAEFGAWLGERECIEREAG